MDARLIVALIVSIMLKSMVLLAAVAWCCSLLLHLTSAWCIISMSASEWDGLTPCVDPAG